MSLPTAGLRDALDRGLESTIVLSFSKVGHAARNRLFGWNHEFDGRGKVAIVTGATSGLGLETAVQLATAGAQVHILARSRDKADRAVQTIVQRSGNPVVRVSIADLCDLASVRRFAEEVQSEHSKVDVLVHNAGALLAEHVQTVDGMEATFQTQVVGPALLTHLLHEPLRRAGGRVIFVASGGLYSQVLDPLSFALSAAEHDGTVAYARAKRAQLALTHLWSEGLAPDGITVRAMHPGWADTPGVATALPTFRKLMGPLLRDTTEGADTIVWLALSEDVDGGPGGFWLDRARRPEHRLRRTRLTPDEERRRESALWDLIVQRAGLPADALGLGRSEPTR